MSHRKHSSAAPRTLILGALAVEGWPADIRSGSPDLAGLRARADPGDAAALTALAVVLLRGEGVTRNVNEAVRLSERAVSHGHVPALFNLATLFETRNGVPANPARAFELYRRAS